MASISDGIKKSNTCLNCIKRRGEKGEPTNQTNNIENQFKYFAFRVHTGQRAIKFVVASNVPKIDALRPLSLSTSTLGIPKAHFSNQLGVGKSCFPNASEDTRKTPKRNWCSKFILFRWVNCGVEF